MERKRRKPEYKHRKLCSKNMNIIPLLTTHNLTLKKGFTLIELLIAVGIIGIISVVTVNLLFSTVLNRSRQNSIQYSSEDVRNFMELMSKNIKEANSVDLISPTEIKITGYDCRTFHLEGTSVAMAVDTTSPVCTPPISNSTDPKITDKDTYVDVLNISKSGSTITVVISGKHKDSFGQHDFSYNTLITKRTN